MEITSIMSILNRNLNQGIQPKLHQFEFYKDHSGWFIDFPEYIEKGYGTKADLAMVQGADDLLDSIGNGNKRVQFTFSNVKMDKARIELVCCAKNQWGATYNTNNETVPKVWLCNVTKLFFDGTHPHRIYIY